MLKKRVYVTWYILTFHVFKNSIQIFHYQHLQWNNNLKRFGIKNTRPGDLVSTLVRIALFPQNLKKIVPVKLQKKNLRLRLVSTRRMLEQQLFLNVGIIP